MKINASIKRKNARTPENLACVATAHIDKLEKVSSSVKSESKKQASKVVRKAGLCYRCQRRKASGPTKSCRVCRLRKLSDHMLVKILTIWVYGGKCACKPCSEKDINFLTLDHIKGGGKQHRKVVNGSLFRWAWRNNFPKSLRLLCYNCNSAREHNGGVCPHVKIL